MSQAETGKLNTSPDEDSSSYSSNSNDFNYSYPPYPSSSCSDFNYPYPTKPAAMKSHYVDMDPENQNFLLEPNTGKKKYETEYEHPGTTSFGMSVFNLSNAIVGSGILGLSYAMANTGIALFLILLSVVSVLSLYSVHLLLKTANEGGSLLYEQLGMKAFGMAGKLAASGSITMQNIGAMSSYLYIVKYELPLVIKAFTNIEESTGEWYLNGDYLVILVSLVLILPLSLLKNLGYLGYTSGFSLLCMVFFLIVVICKKFQIPCGLDHDIVNATLNITLEHLSTTGLVHGTELNATTDDVCTPKYFIINSQTVYAIPILTFSFVCHPAILPIYEELKSRSRRRMMKVSNVSFFAMFLMYLLAALFGYLTFYGNVEPELLHTYSAVLGSDILLLVVRLAVLMAVTLTVPVVIFPIRSSVTQLMCSKKEFSWIRHTAITLAVLVFTNILVIFVPTIRDIFGFIGASAAAMLIFILPSAFYIKLVKKEPMKSVQKIGAALFLISGVLVMTGSITLIILDWTHNAASNGH
ncbi:sodium-coupled neutral amino acid symporter 2 [Tiliqua scincoides]|uniref:sodium-coupled neutral amino acid symporter 2 n=1 Tax=Tiliqua scincoides TaxID=71010 RepID=UPI003461B743